MSKANQEIGIRCNHLNFAWITIHQNCLSDPDKHKNLILIGVTTLFLLHLRVVRSYLSQHGYDPLGSPGKTN